MRIEELACNKMNNDNCSKYFKFNDFIECSDTYKRVLCENEPKQPETYLAIKELACNVLDRERARARAAYEKRLDAEKKTKNKKKKNPIFIGWIT